MDLRYTTRYTAALPLLAVAVSLTGCGGASHTSPGAPASAGSSLRVFQPGDTWTYSVSGYETQAGSPNLTVSSGSYVLGVQTDAQTGDNSFSHALTIKWSDGSATTQNWHDDFVQSPANSSTPYQIFRRGDNLDNASFGGGGNFEVADPVVPALNTAGAIVGIASYGESAELPGVWTGTGTGLTGDDSYEELVAGSSDTDTLKVTNQESFTTNVIGSAKINVPAGYFTTWDTKQTENYVTQDLTVNSEAWWVPTLGSFVKKVSTSNVTYTNGTVGEQVLTYTLATTNVPH